MENLNKIISEKRISMELSIDEVSSKTKIRPHIIKAIEEGKFEKLPSVYMKAFLKTYCQFLGVPVSKIDEVFQKESKTSETAENENSPATEKNNQKEKLTFKESENNSNEYKELFKKKIPVNKTRINYFNIALYSVIALVVVFAVYFTFFYSSENDDVSREQSPETTLTITDSASKKEKSKNLFNYFNNESDSLVLSAEAKGESWIRIEIDGNKIDEVLLKEGMSKKWLAAEYFIITQGNVGSVTFSRNGDTLEYFGNPGTVAKNIKITEDEVLNTNPINKEQKRTNINRKKQNKPKKKIKKIEKSPIPESNFIKQKEEEEPNRL